MFGEQFPCITNGTFFKIISERKVSEHFKESVVADVVADAVKVVVLAAGAYAFLRGCGTGITAGFVAGKDIFELYHTRVGEHQGRIVVGHKRG